MMFYPAPLTAFIGFFLNLLICYLLYIKYKNNKKKYAILDTFLLMISNGWFITTYFFLGRFLNYWWEDYYKCDQILIVFVFISTAIIFLIILTLTFSHFYHKNKKK